MESPTSHSLMLAVTSQMQCYYWSYCLDMIRWFPEAVVWPAFRRWSPITTYWLQHLQFVAGTCDDVSGPSSSILISVRQNTWVQIP